MSIRQQSRLALGIWVQGVVSGCQTVSSVQTDRSSYLTMSIPRTKERPPAPLYTHKISIARAHKAKTGALCEIWLATPVLTGPVPPVDVLPFVDVLPLADVLPFGELLPLDPVLPGMVVVPFVDVLPFDPVLPGMVVVPFAVLVTLK